MKSPFWENFWLQLAFVLLSLFKHFPVTFAYSSGAPSSVCDSMIPEQSAHGGIPQTSASPYTIQLSSTSVTGSQAIDITIDGKGNKFKGFFIQVRKASGGIEPQGTFDPDKSTKDQVNLVNCAGKNKNAATQKSPDEKLTVDVHWIAPCDAGDYKVFYTVVEERTKFWTYIEHPEKIVVAHSSSCKDTTDSPTTPPPTTLPASDLLKQALEEIYKDCGVSAGCFGIPLDCVSKKACAIMATWRKNKNDENEFALTGRLMSPMGTTGYIALGLSKDDQMGTDSVVACAVTQSDESIKRYYNDGKSNEKHKDDTLGLKPVSIANIDGHLFCNFTQMDHEINGLSINFKEKYFYMIARGDTDPAKGLLQHPIDDRAVTDATVDIRDSKNVGATKEQFLFVYLHGTCMLFAWIPFASVGTFVARYFKQTFRSKVCGRSLWLTIHVTCMVTVALLSLVGLICIIILKKAIDLFNPHASLGLVAMVLAIPQGIAPLFRNSISNRAIFTWFHFTFGLLISILTLLCMYFTLKLDKTQLQKSTVLWIGLHAGVVIFTLFMHGAMTWFTYWADGRMEVEPEFRCRACKPGPMSPNGMFEDVPGKGLQLTILGVFAVGLLFITSLLTLTVCQILT